MPGDLLKLHRLHVVFLDIELRLPDGLCVLVLLFLAAALQQHLENLAQISKRA